jgi:hypothetical protein
MNALARNRLPVALQATSELTSEATLGELLPASRRAAYAAPAARLVLIGSAFAFAFWLGGAGDAANLWAQQRGFRGGRGPDVSFAADRDTFHFLLENHRQIRREVTPTADGVITVTRSDDPQIAARIQEHAHAMHERVQEIRPIRMRDPLFAGLFQHARAIEMRVEEIDGGVKVWETSRDPYVARLIQAHAEVVSKFVARGFAEAPLNHEVPLRDLPRVPSPPAEAEAATVSGETIRGEAGASDSRHDPRQLAFANFDRGYIPALALTFQQKGPAAKVAMERLNQRWERELAGEFFAVFAGDTQWPRDFSQIAQTLALATVQVETGRLSLAHETLEPLRELLVEARRRNGLAYPLDAVARYHRLLEAIVKPAMGASPAKLTAERQEQLTQLASEAAAAWEEVEQTALDVTLFERAAGRQAELGPLIVSERAALDALQAALASQDPVAILACSRALKPPYAQLVMFFGDFPTVASAGTPLR